VTAPGQTDLFAYWGRRIPSNESFTLGLRWQLFLGEEPLREAARKLKGKKVTAKGRLLVVGRPFSPYFGVWRPYLIVSVVELAAYRARRPGWTVSRMRESPPETGVKVRVKGVMEVSKTIVQGWSECLGAGSTGVRVIAPGTENLFNYWQSGNVLRYSGIFGLSWELFLHGSPTLEDGARKYKDQRVTVTGYLTIAANSGNPPLALPGSGCVALGIALSNALFRLTNEPKPRLIVVVHSIERA
jgi:hypothetical protein